MEMHRGLFSCTILLLLFMSNGITAERDDSDVITACQHLRRAESRRAKLFELDPSRRARITIPNCTTRGEFEPIQCEDEKAGINCWCVDEYGVKLPGTDKDRRGDIKSCTAINECPASSCRMFCPSGFRRDTKTGCTICQCRDPCDDVECPGALTCQAMEIKCDSEPCPPVPTCRQSRSLDDLCPAGGPLKIKGTERPFLCGTDPGKPNCPPMFQCNVQKGNDYGVCCRAEVIFEKPGVCPRTKLSVAQDAAEAYCSTLPSCAHDLECPQLQKCCELNACGRQKHCQMPSNVTNCHQHKMLAELLSLSDREGRGYIPNCDGSSGSFSPKQCSRNGLVCWCVEQENGHKIEGTMGAAGLVNCDGVAKKSTGRSFDMAPKCDQNICAAVCEYGFKNDHNNCPTCECSEPCEGYHCSSGFHCEVAKDAKCTSGSSLCAAEPVCKPDIVYSNPCEIGTPLVDNATDEVVYCNNQQRNSREYQARAFFDDEDTSRNGRSDFSCPDDYQCTKLQGKPQNVCCPIPSKSAPEDIIDIDLDRKQSMCEYLRDFSSRMVGTEEQMFLALPSPTCSTDGSYQAKQCVRRKKTLTRAEQLELQATKNRRQSRSSAPTAFDHGFGQQRSARIVDSEAIDQQKLSIDSLKEKGTVKHLHLSNSAMTRNDDIPVEVYVTECWCVDGFGTEIPNSRSNNSNQVSCDRLRKSIDCLDITCRMGCDYGFVLDPETKCPSCECRDPCDGALCPENYECRSVDVACEGEYCPPVPACLPKKPGQCPFLVPPGTDGSDIDSCQYECRSDSHCDTNKKCCSNGCGTQCIEPQLKTACQHLQTIQYHQAIELGVPAKQKYIAQCDENTGRFKEVQCGPDNVCWCVDEQGNEVIGTKTVNGAKPNCFSRQSPNTCPMYKCSVNCEHGYVTDAQGCKTCQCQDPCDQISCPVGEMCQLLKVYCIDEPCPKMPICVPNHDSVCTEGQPLKQNGKIVSCGPQRDADQCPSTHSCQLDITSRRGVCCGKTRDVCFESVESSCVDKSKNDSSEITATWQFNSKLNKCVYRSILKSCHTKNSFHSESACSSVCPTLTSCERLRLRNEAAARRVGQLGSWFQPRCDSETGSWSAVQCLGTTIEENEVGRALQNQGGVGVCWCADKKGAPIKGSLTRNSEPSCNFRQARRKSLDPQNRIMDPVMEELIRQLTVVGNDLEGNVEESLNLDDEGFLDDYTTAMSTVTEKLLTTAGSKTPRHLDNFRRSTSRLIFNSTRCLALKKHAPFSVACDNAGGFMPTQCNDEVCWCVDEAGNQLPFSGTFKISKRKHCLHTPIDSVTVQLHLTHKKGLTFSHLHNLLTRELTEILDEAPNNLAVRENDSENSVFITFEITDDAKIDKAFAIEEMVKQKQFYLGDGELIPDITMSRFVHHSSELPTPQRSSGKTAVTIGESTFQTIVFVLTTTSAFLVSILVVFIMLKRGSKDKLHAYETNKTVCGGNNEIGMGDKFLDYSSPIFVLSPTENQHSSYK